MQFDEYEITELTEMVPHVYQLRVKLASGEEIFPFIAGQFCQIKNPTCDRPEQPHSFSIASSPQTRDYLEFCFKTYGPWTQALARMQVGQILKIAGPVGKFVWEDGLSNAVFLAGGVGIVPMLSMARHITQTHQTPELTLLYGNRTQDDIAYLGELNDLFEQIPEGKIVNILSDVPQGTPWQGYTGYITKEILEKEANLTKNPTFFICGPPIFVQLIKDLLKELGIDPPLIKHELFSSPPAPKV